MDEYQAAGLNLVPWQIIKRTADKRIRSFNYLKRYACRRTRVRLA